MNIGTNGINLIKHFEGFINHPYLCPAGVATIGYGSTYYPNGTVVTLQDPNISEPIATQYLMDNLSKFCIGVSGLVKVSLNQNQFDALVSFAYNLGIEALRSSTLLLKVNRDPNDVEIRVEFNKWVHSNGIILPGLVLRREKESDLYFL